MVDAPGVGPSGIWRVCFTSITQRETLTTLKIHTETHELPRMSDVSALLEVKIRLQTSSERIEQSQIIIVRAGDRIEQSADRLLR